MSKILVTGSSGHLGEALVRTLINANYEVVGIDIRESDSTITGSIVDREFVKRCMHGVKVVFHTATLHKPHLMTHKKQDFIDTNISGTLNLLEEAIAANVHKFIFTSTTSVFGAALTPPAEAPAVWVTEEITPVPKNIYGLTKHSAEHLCEMFHRTHGLPCIVMRTSRFFPEEDDRFEIREKYEDLNIKVNEFLYRRVDLEDVVEAHLLAMEKAALIGFGRYIISANTPFTRDDVFGLRANAPHVLKSRVPEYEPVYARLGWKMFPEIERVYDNERAKRELGWHPKHDFVSILERLNAGEDPRSRLSRAIGSKGYHPTKFSGIPYPSE